jgi:hypothetical protein
MSKEAVTATSLCRVSIMYLYTVHRGYITNRYSTNKLVNGLIMFSCLLVHKS